jgi:hypothetical protein
MGMIFEDLDDHEGYAARPLPGGTLTSTWIRDTVAFDAYVGACTLWLGRHRAALAHRSGPHGRRGPVGARTCPPAARRRGSRPRNRAGRQPS